MYVKVLSYVFKVIFATPALSSTAKDAVVAELVVRVASVPPITCAHRRNTKARVRGQNSVEFARAQCTLTHVQTLIPAQKAKHQPHGNKHVNAHACAAVQGGTLAHGRRRQASAARALSVGMLLTSFVAVTVVVAPELTCTAPPVTPSPPATVTAPPSPDVADVQAPACTTTLPPAGTEVEKVSQGGGGGRGRGHRFITNPTRGSEQGTVTTQRPAELQQPLPHDTGHGRLRGDWEPWSPEGRQWRKSQRHSAQCAKTSQGASFSAPDADVAVVAPAARVNLPPAPESVPPTSTDTVPAAPSVAAPTPMDTRPAEPEPAQNQSHAACQRIAIQTSTSQTKGKTQADSQGRGQGGDGERDGKRHTQIEPATLRAHGGGRGRLGGAAHGHTQAHLTTLPRWSAERRRCWRPRP